MSNRRHADRRRVAGIAALTLATAGFVGFLTAAPADAAARIAVESDGGTCGGQDLTCATLEEAFAVAAELLKTESVAVSVGVGTFTSPAPGAAITMPEGPHSLTIAGQGPRLSTVTTEAATGPDAPPLAAIGVDGPGTGTVLVSGLTVTTGTAARGADGVDAVGATDAAPGGDVVGVQIAHAGAAVLENTTVTGLTGGTGGTGAAATSTVAGGDGGAAGSAVGVLRDAPSGVVPGDLVLDRVAIVGLRSGTPGNGGDGPEAGAGGGYDPTAVAGVHVLTGSVTIRQSTIADVVGDSGAAGGLDGSSGLRRAGSNGANAFGIVGVGGSLNLLGATVGTVRGGAGGDDADGGTAVGAVATLRGGRAHVEATEIRDVAAGRGGDGGAPGRSGGAGGPAAGWTVGDGERLEDRGSTVANGAGGAGGHGSSGATGRIAGDGGDGGDGGGAVGLGSTGTPFSAANSTVDGVHLGAGGRGGDGAAGADNPTGPGGDGGAAGAAGSPGTVSLQGSSGAVLAAGHQAPDVAIAGVIPIGSTAEPGQAAQTRPVRVSLVHLTVLDTTAGAPGEPGTPGPGGNARNDGDAGEDASPGRTGASGAPATPVRAAGVLSLGTAQVLLAASLLDNPDPAVPDCRAAGTAEYVGGGENVDGDGTCSDAGPDNETVADLARALQPLASNDGPTRTRALDGASPAATAVGADALCTGVNAADQRGAARPAFACAAGAFQPPAAEPDETGGLELIAPGSPGDSAPTREAPAGGTDTAKPAPRTDVPHARPSLPKPIDGPCGPISFRPC
ncbi:MAG: choice-of-anchor Q domain-containing protein [Sporichthyaceae bacterium]